MTKKNPITIEAESGEVSTYPSPRIRLASIGDVRREMALVYRQAKNGRLDIQSATRLTYILSNLGKIIEIEKIEPRIRELEERLK